MGLVVGQSTFLTLGIVGAAGLMWAHTQGVLPESLPASLRDWRSGAVATEAPTAVLVVLVPDADAVAAVRHAVSADRIVAASAEGIALRERRIVAASRDAAGELIGRAGWVDAQIEILTPGAREAARPSPARASPGAVSESDAVLIELMNKPTLSEAEAMRALESLY
jgi:hypothetical protein